MSEAFITGSRAYGKPKKSSDVDLVIRCDEETANVLKAKSETGEQPIRFGQLNVIICTTDEQFAVWKLGTVEMKRKKQKGKIFDKNQAKRVFDKLREMIGIVDLARDSGEWE